MTGRWIDIDSKEGEEGRPQRQSKAKVEIHCNLNTHSATCSLANRTPPPHFLFFLLLHPPPPLPNFLLPPSAPLLTSPPLPSSSSLTPSSLYIYSPSLPHLSLPPPYLALLKLVTDANR